MKCSICGTEHKLHNRVPSGWKRTAQGVFCGPCWRKLYVMRAITLPVVGLIEREAWPRLSQSLKSGWADSTRLANWTVAELAKLDVVRTADMPKLPKFSIPYLYPAARLLVPQLPSCSVVAVLNTVQSKYLSERYERIWLGSRSLPTFRYPVPMPVPAQGYSVVRKNDRQIFSVRVGSERFDLILAAGAQYRRQSSQIDQIISGHAVPAEAALLQQTVSASDHRRSVIDREPGGGVTRHCRIMAKICAWLPREAPQPRANTLRVTTGLDHFFTARLEGRDDWIYHAEHVRRRGLAYQSRLQSYADDQKYERRRTTKQRQPINDSRQVSSDKMGDRIGSFADEAVRHLLNFADRQKCAKIIYDDTHKSYLPIFGWAHFREDLKVKAEAIGIMVEFASGAVVEDAPAALAEIESPKI